MTPNSWFTSSSGYSTHSNALQLSRRPHRSCTHSACMVARILVSFQPRHARRVRGLMVQTLVWPLLGFAASLMGLGVYRHIWRYTSVAELTRLELRGGAGRSAHRGRHPCCGSSFSRVRCSAAPLARAARAGRGLELGTYRFERYRSAID